MKNFCLALFALLALAPPAGAGEICRKTAAGMPASSPESVLIEQVSPDRYRFQYCANRHQRDTCQVLGRRGGYAKRELEAASQAFQGKELYGLELRRKLAAVTLGAGAFASFSAKWLPGLLITPLIALVDDSVLALETDWDHDKSKLVADARTTATSRPQGAGAGNPARACVAWTDNVPRVREAFLAAFDEMDRYYLMPNVAEGAFDPKAIKTFAGSMAKTYGGVKAAN